MSIQFRARTLTQIIDNYSPSVSESDVGCCCAAPGGTNKTNYSRSKCLSLPGFFVADDYTCSNCPSTRSCLSFTVQSNTSGSCCYWFKENEIYYSNCTEKESELECANIHEGYTEGIKYKFNSGESCTDSQKINCNTTNLLGNCCTQQVDNSVSCSITQKRYCDGFWSYRDYIQSCSGSTCCSGVYFSGITAERSSAVASLIKLQTTTNPIEYLPEPNSIYQGGLYVGIFMPGSPINSVGSVVLGNSSTGLSKSYKARGDGDGLKYKKWILIASQQDFPIPKNCKFSSILLKNSSYDGAFNTNNSVYIKDDLYDKVKNYKHNGFSDWYIPSQDELAFYTKNMPFDNDVLLFQKFHESLYASSTVYAENKNQKFNNNYLLYAQNFNKDKYGEVCLISRNALINVRLFRRIYLND